MYKDPKCNIDKVVAFDMLMCFTVFSRELEMDFDDCFLRNGPVLFASCICIYVCIYVYLITFCPNEI